MSHKLLLELCDIEKSFGMSSVLNRLSFSLKLGEIVGFLGKNGSGKTTTMRIILNLLCKDAGSVRFAGKETTADSSYLRKIGYVQQSGGLIEELTLKENLYFFAGLYGFRNREFAKRFTWYMNEFHMNHLASAYIKTFSKGMKQKVTLIRALLHDPQFLILDEPFTSLDPWEQENAIDVLHKFHAQGGKTILLSSHILGDIEKLTTRVLLLNNGKIEKEFNGTDKITEQIRLGLFRNQL